MRKNALPVGYCHKYPWLKQILRAVPLMAGIGLTNAAFAADEVPGVIAMAQQQAVEISGTVVDSHGEPLMGVNVVEVGTTNGTMTDMDGRFTLSVPSNATLQFSYIGYASQSIAVNGQRTINITLEEDSQNLDELVVVGYGTVRKADLAGSVSVLSNKSQTSCCAE